MNQGTVLRLQEGHVIKEGVNGSKSLISGPGGVAALLFEVLQKGPDEWCIQIDEM
jgi:hypothetical protein